jgi:hypothetical protein
MATALSVRAPDKKWSHTVQTCTDSRDHLWKRRNLGDLIFASGRVRFFCQSIHSSEELLRLPNK